MKTESTVKYVLRLTLTLLIITAVVAALLSVVNGVTAPLIAAEKERKIQAAIGAVLEGGGTEIDFTDDTGMVQTLYQGENGYAVQVAPQGFNGAITMMVGIDNEGNVHKITVISQAETAGLGAIAAANNAAGNKFREEFVGLTGEIAVDKDGGEVEAITGATITSRAVANGVNAALKCVANLNKEG